MNSVFLIIPTIGVIQLLNVSANNYVWNGLVQKRGVNIMVHDKETLPSRDLITASPGLETDVSIEKQIYKRLKYPYRYNEVC